MKMFIRSSVRQFAHATNEPTRTGCCKIFAFLLFGLLFAGNVLAADAGADFNAANKLYAEGKFAAAAAGYEKMLRSRMVSPALWFNYGNAEFKLGQTGRAIAAYRRAELLAPRDDEVRANLDFARKQVEGPTVREGRLETWFGILTLNEWAMLAASTFWITLGLLVARQIRPDWRARSRSATVGIAIATILLCAGLGTAATIHFSSQTAVVIVSEATAHSGPFTEAQEAFKAHNGAELSVLNRRQNWYQVSDGVGRIGWLPANQVQVLPCA